MISSGPLSQEGPFFRNTVPRSPSRSQLQTIARQTNRVRRVTYSLDFSAVSRRPPRSSLQKRKCPRRGCSKSRTRPSQLGERDERRRHPAQKTRRHARPRVLVPPPVGSFFTMGNTRGVNLVQDATIGPRLSESHLPRGASKGNGLVGLLDSLWRSSNRCFVHGRQADCAE